jgi:hypothetical protein
MKSYEDIGLDSSLRKIGGIASEERRNVSAYDFGVNYQLPTGGLSYTQLNPASRPHSAIVTLSKKQGSFDNIQAAINHVNSLGGGTVFIKAGIYVLSSDLTLFSDITLQGEDSDTTIIDFNNTTYEISAVGTFDNPLKNIHLKNIQVKRSLNITYGAIRFSYVNDSSIEDCYFTGNWDSDNSDGRDIYFFGVYRINIARCRSVLSGWLLYGAGSYNVLEKCFSNDSYKGLCYGIGYYGFIRNNIILDATDVAIDIPGNNTGTQIINNYIWSQASYGIKVNCPEVLIEGNEIDGTSLGDDGIFISGSVNNTRIVSNLLYRITGNGVYLSASCNGNQITSNQFYLCSEYGAVIAGTTCNKNIILGNVFFSCGSAAYNDLGTLTEIAHNVTY